MSLPTFHIRTYGCQMNERDSEAAACTLEAEGFRPAATEDVAKILGGTAARLLGLRPNR